MGSTCVPCTIYMTPTAIYYSAGPVQVHSPRTFPHRSVLPPSQPLAKPFREACSALRRLARRLARGVPAGLMLQGTIPAGRRTHKLLSHAPSTGLVRSWSVLARAWSSVPSAPGPSMLTPAVLPQRGRVLACLGAHHDTSQQETAREGRAVTLQGAAHRSRGEFCPRRGKMPSEEDRAGYEGIAIHHVLPLSGEGLWRLWL